MPPKFLTHAARQSGTLHFKCAECQARFDPAGYASAPCALCTLPIYFKSLAEANAYKQATTRSL